MQILQKPGSQANWRSRSNYKWNQGYWGLRATSRVRQHRGIYHGFRSVCQTHQNSVKVPKDRSAADDGGLESWRIKNVHRFVQEEHSAWNQRWSNQAIQISQTGAQHHAPDCGKTKHKRRGTLRVVLLGFVRPLWSRIWRFQNSTYVSFLVFLTNYFRDPDTAFAKVNITEE